MLIAALLILFTALCVLLSGDGTWDNVTKPERNELVFDGRHRNYGAFVLRRDYDRQFILAFLGAVGILGASVAVPKVMAMMGFTAPTTTICPAPPHITDVEFQPTIPDAPKPPAPEPPAPKPAVAPPVAPTPEPGFVVAVDSLPTPDPVPAPKPGPDPGPVVPAGPTGPVTGPVGGSPSNGTSSPFTVEHPTDPAMVDVMPEFVGGYAAMTEFIQRNFPYLHEEISSGKEWVAFVVDADGSVVRVRAKGRAAKEFSEAAERVVRAMPKWKPAEFQGQNVPCMLVLPIELTSQ
jgi:periplasmic protein TonB